MRFSAKWALIGAGWILSPGALYAETPGPAIAPQPPVAIEASPTSAQRANPVGAPTRTPIREIKPLDLSGVGNLEQLLAKGWQVKNGEPTRWSIKEGALEMVSQGDSVILGAPLEIADPKQYPVLAFELKIEAVPKGADPSRKETDDGAFQLYLLFDKDTALMGLLPGQTLCYLWSSGRPAKGESLTSTHSDNVKIISIGGGQPESGEWMNIEIDYLADYRRLFGADEIPALKAISLQADSDNVQSESRARVRNIRLAAYP